MIAFILVGSYYVFLYSLTYKFGESMENAAEKITSKANLKSVAKSKQNLYINILGASQISNFTGINNDSDTTCTNSLLIEAIDSFYINYIIESLINWNSKPLISGIAKIDSSTINNSIWKIQTKEGALNSAYRFTDEQAGCVIEILISKIAFHKADAIVYRTCGVQEEKLTCLLRNK